MELQLLLALTLVLLVAILYSSVGHGGASGYQAILATSGFSVPEVAGIALILNILAAGLSFANYRQNNHFSWGLTWPFVLASIPAAFMGSLIHIPDKLYGGLLSVALLFAAWRLLCSNHFNDPDYLAHPPTLPIALSIGGGIGLFSGMLGIGGGIFLSPILLCMRWGNAKQTASTSAFFILVNAFAGLGGRLLSHNLVIANAWLFAPVVIVGGILGSSLGANRFQNLTLCRLLAFVLLLAAGRLLWPNGVS